MKALPALEGGEDQFLQVPEGVDAGAVHFADAPVGQVHGGSQAAGFRGNGQLVKGFQHTRLRVRIVVEGDQPFGFRELPCGAVKTEVKTTGAAQVLLAVDDVQARVRVLIQPRLGAVGRGVVDHDHPIEGLIQGVPERLLELLQSIEGDDDRDGVFAHGFAKPV